MSTSLRVRATALTLAASTMTTMTGCGFDGVDLTIGDTPLEVTATRIGYSPGDPITGTVVNPEGDITVTLTPAPVNPTRPLAIPTRQHVGAPGVQPCEYAADTRTYLCPTTGPGGPLPEGRYVVQATDAGMPSEGTVSVAVAISTSPSYDPAAGIVPHDESAGETGEAYPREAYVIGRAGEPTSVPLTGWAPRSTVRVEVRADGGALVSRTRARIRDDGAATVVLDPVRAGQYYSLVLTDTVWAVRVPFVVERRS